MNYKEQDYPRSWTKIGNYTIVHTPSPVGPQPLTEPYPNIPHQKSTYDRALEKAYQLKLSIEEEERLKNKPFTKVYFVPPTRAVTRAH